MRAHPHVIPAPALVEPRDHATRPATVLRYWAIVIRRSAAAGGAALALQANARSVGMNVGSSVPGPRGEPMIPVQAAADNADANRTDASPPHAT